MPILKDNDLLKCYGWVVETQCPYGIRHLDGSFATGNAAIKVIESLRRDWLKEHFTEYPSDDDLLDRAGWDLECCSPFEIRHRISGSFATFLAAKMILDVLRKEYVEEIEENRHT